MSSEIVTSSVLANRDEFPLTLFSLLLKVLFVFFRAEQFLEFILGQNADFD